MTPYKPSGESGSSGILRLVAVSLVTGAAVGGLLHVIGNWFRLFILFPVAMGVVTGAVVATMVGSGKVRAPMLAFLIAFAGGALAWSTDTLIVSYFRERSTIRTQIEAIAGEGEGEARPDAAAIDRAVDATLIVWGRGEEMSGAQVQAALGNERVTQDDGKVVEPQPAGMTDAMVGFALYKAKQGTTISRRGSDQTFGETGTLILWLLEILLAGGLAGFAARSEAKKPFCEQSKEWYLENAETHLIGGDKEQKAIVAAVEAGDASALGGLAAGEGKHALLLSVRKCPTCADVPFSVQIVRVAGGKSHAIREGLVPADTVKSMIAALEKKHAEVEAAEKAAQPPQEGAA